MIQFIIKKLDDLKSLQRLIEEAQNESDALRDEIKDFMGSTEEITVGNYNVTYHPRSLTSEKIEKYCDLFLFPEYYSYSELLSNYSDSLLRKLDELE